MRGINPIVSIYNAGATRRRTSRTRARSTSSSRRASSAACRGSRLHRRQRAELELLLAAAVRQRRRRRRGAVVLPAARRELRRDQGDAPERHGDRRRARLARRRRPARRASLALPHHVHPRSRSRVPRERPQDADHGRLRRARVRRHVGDAAEHAARRARRSRKATTRSSSQLLGQAFDGTAQRGSTLPIFYGEFGVESAIPADKAGVYTGTESAKTVDEATQARYYAEAFRLALCQPNVIGIMVFHVSTRARSVPGSPAPSTPTERRSRRSRRSATRRSPRTRAPRRSCPDRTAPTVSVSTTGGTVAASRRRRASGSARSRSSSTALSPT